jgi:UDP-N-acetylglucosamine 4,6-dehydratase
MHNKVILVTGGAGSIGSALVRTLVKMKPKKVIVFDQDETGIFDIEEECGSNKVIGVLGSIRDKICLQETFKKYKPDIVFHTAAYKHVVMCERYPAEAYKTNILGLLNLLSVCTEYKPEKFIFISSDKAVNPSSEMGKTKLRGEKFCKEFNKKFPCIIVRFGNVMASRGSVVPTWFKNIAENKDLPVTHPLMKRYFLGIYDAVKLVIEAATIGKGGEIFILDMGKAVVISELAKTMINLSGKNLNIKYTHPGKGEKFSEVLMTKQEQKKAKRINNLLIIK